MAAFKTNTASKCVLMFSKNSYLFHVNMKLFLAIVNMSNWSQKEIFKSIKENSDQLQGIVDIYGLTLEEQEMIPKEGKY